MRKLFDFQCQSCNEVFEEYTEYKKVSACPKCGMEADKIISAPHIYLEGITGSFPGAALTWEKRHRIGAK
jgi:putative FmdB family regulatory protein